MYAVFTLEEAVGVFALNENIGGLDTRGIAILVVHDLIGKAVTLCPAGVHAVQHRAPVLCLGAAGTGVEGYERVVAVVLAGQQRAQLLLGNAVLQLLVAAFQLLKHGFVVFFDRHFADGEQVIAQLGHLVVRFNLALERAHAGDDLLALLRIIPETRLRGLDLQLLYLTLRLLQTERGVQLLKLGLEVVQLDLVFLKFQHENAPSLSDCSKFQYLIVYRFTRDL